MPKKQNAGRKSTVIHDELGIKGSGLYAYMPFYNLDKNDNAVFKVGMTTTSFKSRTEQYHTYFPMGVYTIAFLEDPPVPQTEGDKETTKRTHYKKIERFIFDELIRLGAKQIHTTSRIRRLNAANEGETEWFYTSDKIIHRAFQKAKDEYGGRTEFGEVSQKDVKEARDLVKGHDHHFTGKLLFYY
jgi:hypothetical protein